MYPRDAKLEELAYFFDFELKDTLQPELLVGLTEAALAWKERWAAGKPRPRMTFFRSEDFLQIDDARDVDSIATHTFEGPLALLYHALSDSPQSVPQLIRKLGLDYAPETVSEALDEFCQRGLMLEDQGLYLSLALPAGSPR